MDKGNSKDGFKKDFKKDKDKFKNRNNSQEFDKKDDDKHNKNPNSALDATKKIAELSQKLKEKDEEITKLNSQMSEVKESALRIRADAENYRKRVEKDVAAMTRRANEDLIKDLIPSLDSLDLGIKGATDENVKKGLEIVYNALFSVLKKWELEQIDVMGKEFDPNTCEAFLFEDNPELEHDTVVEVLQSGFIYKGKVLRSAKVKVARCGK